MVSDFRTLKLHVSDFAPPPTVWYLHVNTD